MPGGKRRLKNVMTGGIQVGPAGSAGNDISNILSGSVAVTAPSAVAGSPGIAVVTITGLTGCHLLQGMLEGTTGCFGLVSVCPGANSASLMLANWSASTAASKAATLRYIAFRVRQ